MSYLQIIGATTIALIGYFCAVAFVHCLSWGDSDWEPAFLFVGELEAIVIALLSLKVFG